MTKTMKRPLSVVAVVLAFMLAVVSVGVASADSLRFSQDCQILVKLPDSAKQEIAEPIPDIEKATIPFDVYKVATMDNTGKYTPDGAFDVLSSVIPSTIDSESTYTAEELKALNNDIMSVIKGTYVPPKDSSSSSQSAGTPIPTAKPEPFFTGVVQGNEVVVSKTLETGLYFIVPQSKVDYEMYTYKFSPILVPLPSYDKSMSEASPYNYTANVNLKPEYSDRKGSLDIVKTTATYDATQGMQTFVFHIVATKPANTEAGETEAKVVYDNFASMDITKPGQQSIHLEECIPVGSDITVTEVYSGASYKPVGTDSQSASMTLENLNPSVSFENEPGDDIPTGNGIQNSFTYGETTGWVWTPSSR